MKLERLKFDERRIFGVALIWMSFVLVISCEQPDPYPVTPKVTFTNLTFHDIEGQDSLVLEFEFQDGDGDLGLDANAPWSDWWPYHEYSAITGSDFEVISISAETIPSELYLACPYLAIPNNAETLPFAPYNLEVTLPLPDYNCYDYREVWLDTAAAGGNKIYFPKTYYPPDDVPTGLVLDTILVAENPYHYNIYVEFFRRVGNEEEWIDWRNLYTTDGCGGVVFNGRFPMLDYDAANGGTSLEGSVKYRMESAGFKNILRNDEFMIRFFIIDLRQRLSNVDSTGWLTLDDIIVDGQ